MSNVQVSPTVASMSPVIYKDVPVLTTELLAQFYECEPIKIQQNFANNKDRFVEGKHFFKLVGSELEAFRLSYCHSQTDLQLENFELQISSKVRHLTLWTERGAARHAKMLNTDRAWDVFELLEDSYFRGKATPSSRANAFPIDARELHARLKVGKHFSTWFLDRVEVFKFREGVDFIRIGPRRPRTHEYALSQAMADRLAATQAGWERSGQAALPAPNQTDPYRAELDIERLFNALKAAIAKSKQAGLRIGWSWDEKFMSINLHVSRRFQLNAQEEA